MRVFHRLSDIAGEKGPVRSVAIGNFDGVHRGHGSLLARLIVESRKDGFSPGVLTFFPHPIEVLRPGTRLERLTTASEKLELLEKNGMEWTLVEKFDTELASLSAEEFFSRYLWHGLRVRRIHVGSNFRFGKDRTGDVSLLSALSAAHGIPVCVEAHFRSDSVPVSSSYIRQLLRDGDVKTAAQLLGRPFSISGQVAHGDHRGASLGFPTANVTFPDEKILPKNGVYVTRATWQRQRYRAVTNIGVRPTFTEPHRAVPRIEVHLLDFNSKLYDEWLQVEFLDRIRDEKKFDSFDALRAQIQRDVEVARSYGTEGV